MLLSSWNKKYNNKYIKTLQIQGKEKDYDCYVGNLQVSRNWQANKI